MNSLFSVTTASIDTNLLTIAELRAAAGVAAGVTTYDTELTALGLRLSASIARACGVAAAGVTPPTLLSETCREVFRLRKHEDFLRLARRPVTAITSVAFEDDAAEDAADYEVDASTGILRRLGDDSPVCWPCGKITVVYVAGFTTAPNDLKLAASKLCTALYSETARDPSLKREDIPGVMEREYWVAPSDDPLLTQEISELLAPYKQYWF